MAITGRNGVGKSTLLDLIVGDLSSSKGSIAMPPSWRVGYMRQEVYVSRQTAINYVIDGHSELREVERKIAGLSDDEELANLYLRYEDLGGYEAESRAGRILNGLGFHAEEFEKPFEQFSGGWRIRLNLAKALMLPSQLLVLDEPTNHLSVKETNKVLRFVEGLKKQGVTSIFITHNLSHVYPIADHLCVMARGEKIADLAKEDTNIDELTDLLVNG